jgi:hypothetical protein
MPQSFLYDIPPIPLVQNKQAHKSGISVVITSRKMRHRSQRNQLPVGIQNCSRSMLRKKRRRKALLTVFANDGLGKRSAHSDLSCRLRQPEDPLPFLLLGGASLVRNLDFDTRVDTPHAGIILLGPVDPAELAETLDAAPDTAIPIADFGWGCNGQAFETQQTEFTIDNITREPACAAPC